RVVTGELVNNSRNSFLAGAGASIFFATTDAIFAPLAARQVLAARQWDVQTAKNDALLDTAQAYFDVQQARGRLAGAEDSVRRGPTFAERVERRGKARPPPIEADRARASLAELEQVAASAREEWRVASANLTRVLRLHPAAVVVPLEPPQL